MGYEALEDALKNYDDYTDLEDIRNEEAANKKVKKLFASASALLKM